MAVPRIIAGSARGVRLKMVPGDTTRPITDRVKEALFNILGPDVEGSAWLDLFGGTGSVGIEALSRGAGFARFIDLHKLPVATIKENLERTRLARSGEVIQADAFAYLKRTPDRRFDYLYVAPPQYKGLWVKAIEELDANPAWMLEDSWVLAQIDPVEYQGLTLKHLVEFDQRRYGSTVLVFYERRGPEGAGSSG